MQDETTTQTVRWYDRVWAAFQFFTRLPLWRVYQPPRQAYDSVVEYWPLVGWLTGGVTAAVIYFGSFAMAPAVTVVMAIAVRLLLTGALHEDGLADFFDGFGGGAGDRERTLRIMKDSHIGTYGVLGLVVYELLLCLSLLSLSPKIAALCVLAADPYAKMVASQLITMMPYARREDEAKSRVVYRKVSPVAGVLLAVQGLLPIALFLWYTHLPWSTVIFLPALVMYFLYLMIWHRLRGYTGDCCGAVCLLVELSVYLVVSSLVTILAA